MKRFAVVLSGCGHLDGAEISESVSVLNAIDTFGAVYKCFAPNREFLSVDHISKKDCGLRNVMNEAARIARGNISDLKDLIVDDFDALIFPGGYGVVKNLCNFAESGIDAVVLETVSFQIVSFFERAKPIAAVCISGVLLALTLGEKANLMLTLGEESNSNMINSLGCTHVFCKSDDFIKDKNHNVFSTPAYMRNDRLSVIYNGISRMIGAMINV